MGVDVRLENERGEPLKWASGPLPISFLWEEPPLCDAEEFPLAAGIDPYGNTIFNRLQAPQLLREWNLLTATLAETDRKVMNEVAQFIEQCRDKVHLYVRFIGD